MTDHNHERGRPHEEAGVRAGDGGDAAVARGGDGGGKLVVAAGTAIASDDDGGLSAVPGAMAVELSRDLPSGWRIEFEAAPAGWLKADGTPRKKDYRAYFVMPSGDARKWRLHHRPSVTTVCGDVLPKPGLQFWFEEHGIRGTVEALQQGLLGEGATGEEAVQVVRVNRLGAEAARDRAADRGINIHALLEEYMLSGQVPNPADHPENHRPFIQGLVKWIIACDPQPEAVELLVADPERGYAGRADLIARIGKKSVLVDLKTNPDGRIFDSAHLQVELLCDAERQFGEYQIDQKLLVAVDGFGGYREMLSVAGPHLASRALAFYEEAKRVTRKCESADRVHRETRRAVMQP